MLNFLYQQKYVKLLISTKIHTYDRTLKIYYNSKSSKSQKFDG